MDVSISKLIYGFLFFLVSYPHVQGQVLFQRDFSPAEGLVSRYEKDFRDEICLNGYWDLQIIHLPAGWKSGSGVPPILPGVVDTAWEKTKIKIPSPINVNNWGGGQDVGEGTRSPYAPSSVYYPSYPKHWVDARMAWLRKSMTIPAEWESKQVILHFEAVAGECVVYVNGREVYTHFDSYLPFDVDITGYIQPGEKAEVLLGLRHSKLFDRHHPLYDKFGAVYPPGSNTDDLIGIWQDVYLFGLPAVRISDVFVKPWVDRNELDLEVRITNSSKKKQEISLEGDIRKWINNNSSKDPLLAPEISWELDHASALKVNAQKIELKPDETKTVHLSTSVDNKLDTWSPDSPNLYTLLLDIRSGKKTVDRKATRFGWRQFKIVGDEFHLNGRKIQCFGDIQHPFGPYVCSRRFAWAWYTMIKDFGGNAVRPHAQPWPRVYYDLADEMGLMVLDETALFGSSIRLNLEEEITWQRSGEHFRRLILRDRNHPSVIGWSAGNEMFAIALLNKPEKSVSDVWDDKMVAMTLTAKEIDPTRDFITLDGDRDMNGRLPVWSKHFGHGLNLQDLPEGLNKPLIVGESGATYYGKPAQLYSFAGDKAYASYHGRSEALAVDLYQNVTKMARPRLAYFSPSEVCWFGIEHLGLGYNDYSRLPDMRDGIFAGKMYEEGKPGYQYERIPPYVTTFNPGIDPEKPLYKPLPMFEALKAAIAGEPSPWDRYIEYEYTEKPTVHTDQYGSALFLGDKNGLLHRQLEKIGVGFSEKTSRLLIVDAHTYQGGQEKLIEEVKREGGTILLMLRNQNISPVIGTLLPERMELTKRKATALESNKQSAWGEHFDLPALYFSEIKGDKHMLKCGLAGDLTTKGEIILTASRTDWSLFNENPENRKCAQIVLYEQLKKPEGVALVSLKAGNASFIVSALDYTLSTKETSAFWRKLFPVMGIKLNPVSEWMNEESKKEHDLLMDGPVDDALSQSVSFPEDKQKRGYYNRPYKRYEAEPGKCFTTGLFLSPASVQTELQSEASNSMATQLIEKGAYIQWKNEEAADGLVIRFSIPDGVHGGGTKGVIALYVDDRFTANITLDSYWAWQHALKTGQTYPDNLPATNKFARMRFDDLRVKLDRKIPGGATFKLVKVDNNKIPYTIDFVELEPVPPPVTYESISDQNKVSYHLSDGPLDQFIANNGGKTIYIPAGKYDVYERIYIHKPNTKIIGAGMWHTEIYFASPSDKVETYPKRGIQTNQDNTLLDGLYITTANDRRYYVLPDGQNGGVGKGIMGSFGSNSTIRNVWIEHFECGGWITGTNHLTVQQCRFRNQYADGINLATGSRNSVVEYCSFRNNGDDDMASWSSGKNMCENITYRYCTAENNWRASSVGFFGGSGHKALNLLITDGMEAALRATTDFPGQPFSEEGMHLYENISIYNCGAQEGSLGYKGDIISGKTAGAIHLTSYGHYDLLNVQFSNIDIHQSRSDAIYLDSGKDRMIRNIHFKNINIQGAGRHGISFNHAAGEASYCNMVFENVGEDSFGAIPEGFEFTKDEACPEKISNYTRYVDPTIGSGGHGHVFVGASVPYGAVQVGPSNFYKGWDWCSGYNYQDSVIIGFPQLHLSGTGIGDLGDVLLMPYMGDVKFDKGKETERYSGYASRFSHQNETVQPGYYRVKLDDHDIDVELTATERVGFHKYTFPEGENARVIIDLKDGINDKSVETYIELADKYTIKGYRSSEGWAKKQQLFFAIRSSVPINHFSVYEDTTPRKGEKSKGKYLKGLISFEKSPGTLLLKVGISPVSPDNALENIQSEIPEWDFEEITRQADEKWEKELSKIAVETKNEADKRIFYTALYHTMMHPSLFNDYDGAYRGADWRTYKNPGYDNYTIFSLWDTYRAAHPLYTLIDQKRTADFVNSMLDIFDQTGMLPIWHLRGYETGTMVGVSSFQVIAEAYVKGVKGFDPERAFAALKASAMNDVRGLDFDRDMKAIPSDVMKNRPVSTALEYAIGMGSIARMAQKMGKTEEAAYFQKRSDNYKLYYDPEVGFFRGKMADGSWNPIFHPIKSKRPWATDYAEGNPWQYLWLVPHDVEGLIELLGGEKAFVDRLDQFFALTVENDPDVLVDLTGSIGQYAHGNEPSHHIAYLYAYVGQQWKTARLTRHIMKEFYRDQPDGLIGNEDCGQMSAWYILSSLGFYPVFTASGQYVLGSPLFDKATIHLENGNSFSVEAIDNSAENIYIQSVELNGKRCDSSFISHEEIMQGGILRIRMGNKPNDDFGN